MPTPTNCPTTRVSIVTPSYTYLDHMRQYKRDWMRRHRAKLKQRREAAKASWAKSRAPRNPHGYNGTTKRPAE